MSSWDNAGFEQDKYANGRSSPTYQIPRVEISRDKTHSQPKEHTHMTPEIFDDIPLNHLGSAKQQTDVEEDYSLYSYIKHWPVCRKIVSIYSTIPNPDKWKKSLKYFILICLLLGYLVAVFSLLSEIEKEDYWCRGDGFVLCMLVVVAFCLVYLKLVKTYMLPHIESKWHSFKQKLQENTCYQTLLASLIFKIIVVGSVIVAILAFLIWDTVGERERLISAVGILAFLAFGFIFSTAPRKVIWRQVIWGMGLQLVLGTIILRWPTGEAVFKCLADKVEGFLHYSQNGSTFLFGYLVTGNETLKLSSVFAFKVLPVIIFFSLCINILYYYGVMQWLVVKVGWFLQVTVGTTPCESINAAANIFLGMSEAPLLIKPYLPLMTKSELHSVLTGGFATIAGAVLAAYIDFGVDASHLLSASVMSAPAALAFSKLFHPETEISKTNIKDIPTIKGTEANVLHAALEGVSAAIPLVANIGANLLAFIAFTAFIDALLNWSCQLIAIEEGVCSLSSGFGYVFMPLAWLMGVPWADCYNVGQLIGTKTIINEFVAYSQLGEFVKHDMISKRAETIATYALCGFSNIGSIGIQLGALGAMAPSRKADIAKLATRAMIAGNIACFLTACVAGTLISSNPIVGVAANMTV